MRFILDCERFAGEIAARYFDVTRRAIMAADPNHLALGCRFAYRPHASIIEAAGQNIDVVSCNCYDVDPVAAINAYARAGKPCMITEFSFRGDDSGLPNKIGAGMRVATQVDRARAFTDYVAAALGTAALVGYHWFEHADEPAEGRFDGENSNYGVVTINDGVYEEITRAMTDINADAKRLHRLRSALVG